MENLNTSMPDMENMSNEELTQKKEEMLSFYVDSLSYLQAQFDYENILSKIDEVRFKRANIQMQFAMMMQENKEDSDDENEDGEDSVDNIKTKKLKKS
jgi:hypothetical protein